MKVAVAVLVLSMAVLTIVHVHLLLNQERGSIVCRGDGMVVVKHVDFDGFPDDVDAPVLGSALAQLCGHGV